jgi:hypothetical protein
MNKVGKVFVEHYRVPELVGRILKRGGNLKGVPSERQLMRYKRNGQEARAFVPHPNGGKTVVTVVLEDGTEVSEESVCSLSDNFSYKVGRNIAIGRLQKINNLGG